MIFHFGLLDTRVPPADAGGWTGVDSVAVHRFWTNFRRREIDVSAAVSIRSFTEGMEQVVEVMFPRLIMQLQCTGCYN